MMENEKAIEHGEGGGEGEGESVRVREPCARRLLDVLFPLLTLSGGQQRLGRQKSAAILSTLYGSHVFSAWGDRMWQFLVSLLLATVYPGSLLLPAVFGLVLGLLVALFGTLVGDWVDMNPRMKVVLGSLLVQNGLVTLCAVGLAVMFGLDLGICGDVPLPLFIVLSALVIILGAAANLATVANTIAIEKDWIVVIADGNKDTLAVLNANMRCIDLICKLVAPAVAGVILQFAGPLTTTIVIALWNVVSFFVELGLLYLVYWWVPALALKKFRKGSIFEVLDEHEEDSKSESASKGEGGEEEVRRGEGEGGEGGEEERGRGEGEEGEDHGDLGEGGQLQFFDDEAGEEKELFSDSSPTHRDRRRGDSASRACCNRLLSPYVSLRDGWRVYIHQGVALAGIAMATIYLTVLGFSGVTATYFLIQGLPNAAIGVAQGTGAILGVSGTIAYPFIRRRIGTVRTGMFGISTQLMMLSFCAVSVLIPAERVTNPVDSYYAAHCSANDGPSNLSIPFCSYPTTSATSGSLASSLLLTPSHSTSSQVLLSSSMPVPFTSSQAPLTSSPALPTPTPSNIPFSGSGSGGAGNHRPIREAEVKNEASLWTPYRPIREAEGDIGRLKSSAPYPTCLPSQPTASATSGMSWTAGRVVPLALMLLGVMGARFGLWIFDLSVQQLVQETVAEETRGVVGGVMNAMNSIMDMLHYVMVIAAPRPEHFTILTLISVAMVTLGAVLYAVYLRKVRGHFFHCNKYYQFCLHCAGKRTGQASFRQVRQVDNDAEDQNYLLNMNVEDHEL